VEPRSPQLPAEEFLRWFDHGLFLDDPRKTASRRQIRWTLYRSCVLHEFLTGALAISLNPLRLKRFYETADRVKYAPRISMAILSFIGSRFHLGLLFAL